MKCSVCEGKPFKERFSCSNCHGTGEVDWIDNIIPSGDKDFSWITNEMMGFLEKYKFMPVDKYTKTSIITEINDYLDDLVYKGIIHKYNCDEKFVIMVSYFDEDFKFNINLGELNFI
jgi:hypothetical protein